MGEKTTIIHRRERDVVPEVLDGFLMGLGASCHELLGREAGCGASEALGSILGKHLRECHELTFPQEDPWDRFVAMMGAFTDLGLYTRVKMKALEDGKYWIQEEGIYAGRLWMDKTVPAGEYGACALKGFVLHSLRETGKSIALDERLDPPRKDTSVTLFHFEDANSFTFDAFRMVKEMLQSTMVPICAKCHKIRKEDDTWVAFETFFREKMGTQFTHGVCGDCIEDLYGDVDSSHRTSVPGKQSS